FAVGFGDESGMRKVGLCGTHPLTQRYTIHFMNTRLDAFEFLM
ncbi:TPA: DUF3265 domain-containing protein, partial [Vibrio vulnificus]|nr:DUF3265 domain-containing protein [Vibrio vulnificus]HDY8062432.1 DUF3265 domain-containing protein [Vibrio vulnificus]HDY8081488.1 DUF3265 domain-containing protein [Vibrio vulnificus]HDY8192407.1 DUF3265 domain-containing protein [Vibrio vulnificus]